MFHFNGPGAKWSVLDALGRAFITLWGVCRRRRCCLSRERSPLACNQWICRKAVGRELRCWSCMSASQACGVAMCAAPPLRCCCACCAAISTASRLLVKTGLQREAVCSLAKQRRLHYYGASYDFQRSFNADWPKRCNTFLHQTVTLTLLFFKLSWYWEQRHVFRRLFCREHSCFYKLFQLPPPKGNGSKIVCREIQRFCFTKLVQKEPAEFAVLSCKH